MTGRVALITGGNRGLGRATAALLAGRGWRLVLAARDAAALAETREQLTADVPGADVAVARLDLADFESVRAFATDLRRSGRPLHLLLNNAGLIGTPSTLQRSPQGYELQLATNLLGHFLLTDRLLSALRAATPARVVNVSSALHLPDPTSGAGPSFDWTELDPAAAQPPIAAAQQAYDANIAYRNSKLAMMWFTFALGRRLAGSGVAVHAVCPGFVPETAARTQPELRAWMAKNPQTWRASAVTVADAARHMAWVCTAPQLQDRPAGWYRTGHGPHASKPSQQACDEVLQERLWRLSEAAVSQR